MIFVFTLLLTWIGAWFFPWWWGAIAASLVAFWRLRRLWWLLPQAFVAGGVAWLLPALQMDLANASLLSSRLAHLFHLPGPQGMLLATAMAGGIIAALGAIAGQRMRKTMQALRED